MTSIKYPGIRGQLRVLVSQEPGKEQRVYLEGDPDGLRTLGALLLTLAELDQRALHSLPETGASEHVHLRRSDWLTSQSTDEVVIGRLDDKKGGFDETFEARRQPSNPEIVHEW